MEYSVISRIKMREMMAGRVVEEEGWPEWDGDGRLSPTYEPETETEEEPEEEPEEEHEEEHEGVPEGVPEEEKPEYNSKGLRVNYGDFVRVFEWEPEEESEDEKPEYNSEGLRVNYGDFVRVFEWEPEEESEDDSEDDSERLGAVQQAAITACNIASCAYRSASNVEAALGDEIAIFTMTIPAEAAVDVALAAVDAALAAVNFKPVVFCPVVFRPVLDSEEALAGREWMGVYGEHLRWANNNDQIKDLANPKRVLNLNKKWYDGLTLNKRLQKGTLLAMNQEGFDLVDGDPAPPSWFEQTKLSMRPTITAFTGTSKKIGGCRKRPRGSTEAAKAYLKRKLN